MFLNWKIKIIKKKFIVKIFSSDFQYNIPTESKNEVTKKLRKSSNISEEAVILSFKLKPL